MLSKRSLAFFSFFLALPATSIAQDLPRTAVVPFEGRLAPTLRRAVSSAIEEDASLIPEDRVDQAAERADVEGTGANGVPALASSLDAELVVQGEITGSRRSQSVEIVIRSRNGTELARGTASYRAGRRFRQRFERSVRRVFTEAAGALERDAPRADEQLEEEENERPPGMDDEEEAAPSQPAAPPPEDGLAIVSILAGVGVRMRDADIELSAGDPRRYDAVFPEIALGLEVRPFANDSHLGRGIFVHLDFGHSMGLGSRSRAQTECDADPSLSGCGISTNFARFDLRAGWLAPIGDAVELGLGFGGGIDGFYLGPNDVMSTAEFGYLRPAARARFRFAKEAFVLDVDAGYRGILGVGEIAPDFGQGASAHGVDIGAAFTGNMLSVAGVGFTWAARFDYVGYFTSFSGAASDATATSGTEHSVRGTVMIGWAFR
jgi:hypothetical protein